MQNDQQVATLKRLVFPFTLTKLHFNEKQKQHFGVLRVIWVFVYVQV